MLITIPSAWGGAGPGRRKEFIIQKLDYFHNNPCKGKWNLCNSPFEYVHSSAKYYLTGEQGIYPVTGYGELLDIDLTNEQGG